MVETPTYMRYAFAAMDSAGALETQATESFYYVTPVEEHWAAEQAEEWLSKFDYNTLRIISIHEVYPGHFVHHLHNRYGRPLPLVNRVATSYAFTEGWAHYTEQMMLETEYGTGRPEMLLTQLLEALVRNCRYNVLSGHAYGRNDGRRSHEVLHGQRLYGRISIQKEALRGTFDPGYLNYTLGKLMILKLREDFSRRKPGDYSLKGFPQPAAVLRSTPAAPVARRFAFRRRDAPLTTGTSIAARVPIATRP